MDQGFTDILIRVRNSTGDSYPVEAWLSDGSFYEGKAQLSSALLQQLLQWDYEPVQYGEQLFQTLFDGPVGRAYDVATGLARLRSDSRLRIRVSLDESLPADFHALKWERVANPKWKPLAIDSLTPFSRYMALPEAEPQPLDEAVVRLLFAISAPSDLASWNLAPIDVVKEIQRLMEALKDVLLGGRCKATILPGQTVLPPGLRDDLDKAGWDIAGGKTTLDNIGRLLDNHHVFHFLGHGQYNNGQGWLLLENEDGTAGWKADTDLAATLGNTQVRLVFLASCESARRDTGLAAGSPRKSSFQGLAATLVQRGGIPAVVGMQEQLRIDDAYTLTSVFYRKLFLEHGEVDRALNEARAFLYSQDKKSDWGTPVLTMRLKTGQLAVPNPLWTALQAIQEHDDYETIRSGQYINLSVQAILVNEGHDASQYEESELQRIGTRGLIEAVLEHLARGSTARNGASTAPLVLILGGPSSGKSMQMKRLGWETVQAGRIATAEELFLPLYMSLEDYRPSTTEALEGEILDRLRLFLPGLAARSLEKLTKDMPQVQLRILFSAGDTLPEVGRDLVRLAVTLAREHPRHQYVLAIQTSALQWDDLKEIDPAQRCILAIQPLTQRGIRHALEAQGGPGQRLLDAIHGTSLFELASTPFFLVKMLAKARKGQYPISRAETLQQLIDEAITQVPARQGMRANAPRTLFEMAWEMARSDITNLPIGEAFRAIRNLRGEREYDIEALYEALLEQGILLSVGEDTMRFSYSSVQAYCCAKALLALPERNKTLRDLVGSLGSPIQLRRWEETLVMACGLLAMKTSPDDQQTLRLLLEPIILGADLLEGTRVFLGARCLLECRSVLSVRADTKANQDLGKLVAHVVNALRWRADSANEPDLARRLQATQLLAQLAMPEIAVGLARKAYCLVRQNVAKEWDYEFSSVRFAAAIALRRMPPEQAAAALNEISPKLVALFDAWQQKKVNTLIQYAHDSEDMGIQGLAALALGDLHEPLESVKLHEDAQQALNCLKEMFTSGKTCQNVRWAVADALSLLDSARVIDVIVNPLLRELASPGGGTSLKNLAKIRKSLAYLIGLIRLRDRRARNFLVQECLGLKGEAGFKDWRTWATAITALGRVGDRSDMKLLAEIAAGRAKGRKLDDLIPQEEQRNIVRREAINALVAQGDLEVLKPSDRESLANEPDLSRSYYHAIQEIYWRREAAARVAQGKIV